MNFKALFGRREPPKPKPQVVYHTVLFSTMTLEAWRKSTENISYSRALLQDERFRALLGMLSNIRPSLRADLDPTNAAYLLGMRTGHDQIIATILESAKELDLPQEEIPADYGATEDQLNT